MSTAANKEGEEGLFSARKIYKKHAVLFIIAKIYLLFYLCVHMNEKDWDLKDIVLLVLTFLIICAAGSTAFGYSRVVNLKKETDKSAEHSGREEYYQKLEAFQEEVCMMKHDLKSGLLVWYDYLKTGQNEAVKQEIHALLGDLACAEEFFSYSENPAVNALVRSKLTLAARKGIQTEWEIRVPKQIYVLEKDMISLLGNLLDNAIEACEKITDGKKCLKFGMLCFNQSLVISTENSTNSGPIDFSTTKPDKNRHGFGYKSIQKIVRKYHGSFQSSFCGEQIKIEILLWNSDTVSASIDENT